MNAFILADKTLHLGAIGSTERQVFLSRQAEKLIVQLKDEADALKVITDLTCKLKLTKSSSTILAQCLTFTESAEGSKTWKGWLDLNTEEINALADGDEVFIEFKWIEDEQLNRSDECKVIIKKSAVSDAEVPPTNITLAATAQWLQDHVLAGTGITVTANEAAGTITLASTASGGAWGSITGTLADQTDLQSALDAKAAIADLPTLASLGFFITDNGNLKLTIAGTDYFFLAVDAEP